MKKLTVFRVDVSPYQGKNFKANEKSVLESLQHVEYLEEFNHETKKPDILITNSHSDFLKFEQKFDLDNIKLIIHVNSGYDNCPVLFLRGASFPVIAGNKIRAGAVSNYILAALFEQMTTIPKQKKWDHERKWNRDILSEKNILIIGFGHIGKILFKTLSPLAKKIHLFDPFKNHNQLKPEMADILILSSSLNPSSYHIINKQFLEQVPKNMLIINAARGGLIDQNALIDFLGKNKNAFAYLDVFEKEPFPLDELNKLENIKTTSHIAGVYNTLDNDILKFTKTVIQDFQKQMNNPDVFYDIYKELLLKNRINEEYLI